MSSDLYLVVRKALARSRQVCHAAICVHEKRLAFAGLLSSRGGIFSDRVTYRFTEVLRLEPT
jgi:hypothetical protein